jgi:hypothetical protein
MIAVLIQAALQIARDACVQGAALLAGKDIDEGGDCHQVCANPGFCDFASLRAE